MRVLVLGPAELRDALPPGAEPLEPAPQPTLPLAKAERDAFLLTLDRMHEADVLLADATEDRAEVGWAVAWMLARGRLVVLCVAREARPRLTHLLAGNPSPWQRLVAFESTDDLRAQLRAIFQGKS